MTVSTSFSVSDSACNGVTTAFPVAFQFANPSDLIVELIDDATDIATLLVEGTDYTRTGDGMAAPSGIVTTSAYAAGKTIRRRRETPQTQVLDMVPNVGAPAESQERAWDRAILIAQELAEILNRTLRLPIGSTPPLVPAITDAEGKVLAVVSGAFRWIANDSAGVEGAVETAVAAAAAASGFADDAETSADQAAADLVQTGLDVIAAQLAADTAVISAGLYANEATGRAAVADGVIFSAIGATSDKAIDVWQRVNSGSSTLLRSYPSLAALTAAMTALAQAYIDGRYSDDNFVGARAAAVLPAALAATVSGTHFTAPSSGTNVPIVLTVDQVGDTTTPFTATLQIVSGSPGTAFSFAAGRWYNSVGAQIGADVPLTKTATALTLTGTQPAGARLLQFAIVPPADTVCRFLTYQFGTPARPTTDPWYLALLGAGIVVNDPEPVPYIATDANWNPLNGRVTVPATAGGLFQVSVPGGVNDGDVLWVYFDSPLEPTAWLQYVNARFGDGGGGGGNNAPSQVLHVRGNRYAVALYVQSALDGAFYGPRWTWNNTGAATYFENIKLYVGPNPPFIETVPAIVSTAIRDEIDAARIKPLITLADDSCGISSTVQFLPDPGKSLREFLGTGTKFQNFATPGNTLAQSCSTVGLLPIHVSVSGGVIPASTAPVSITAWDYDPLTALCTANPEYDGHAYLCGVLGLITAGSYSGVTPTSLFFTPVVAPAWPIKVPAGSKLILRASRKRKGGLTLFPLSSVNGVGGGFANAVALADAVFAANDPATIAGFIGLTPAPYGTGSSILATFVGKSYYSRLYNPNITSAATVAEAMSLFGWNWTGTENADWLAGNIGIPGSMRIAGDNFHPYTDVSAYVLAKNHFTSAPVTAYLEAWA